MTEQQETLADKRKREFIALLLEGETGQGAARALRLRMQYFYGLRRQDKAFEAAWKAALGTNVEKRLALQKERSLDGPRQKSTLPKTPTGVKNTPDFRARVLNGLSLGHSMTKSCEEAGVSYLAVRKWREKDKEFDELCIDAINQGIDRLEDEARRRAVDGYEEQVLNGKGEVMQTYRRYSDNLLGLMLKSKIQYYRSNAAKVNVAVDGGNVTVNIVGVQSGTFITEKEGVVIEGRVEADEPESEVPQEFYHELAEIKDEGEE